MQNQSSGPSAPLRKGLDFVGISVVYFCHDGKGNFLMHQRGEKARDEQGKWDIGAGALEFEDGVEQTLKKEIMEEYGTNVLSYEFLGFRDVFRKDRDKTTHWVTLDFKVLVDATKAKNNEPHKFNEVRWVTKESMPLPMHNQLPIFLEKYKKDIF